MEKDSRPFIQVFDLMSSYVGNGASHVSLSLDEYSVEVIAFIDTKSDLGSARRKVKRLISEIGAECKVWSKHFPKGDHTPAFYTLKARFER